MDKKQDTSANTPDASTPTRTRRATRTRRTSSGDIAPVLNEVAQTLDMRNQPKLWIGKVESK